MSVGNIVKLQENTHCAKWLRVSWNVGRGCSPDERYQKIRTCLSGEVETPPLPSGVRGSGCEISDKRIRTCLTENNSGWDIRTSQGGPSACVRCRDPSGSTPSGFPKSTCAAMLSGTHEHYTLDDSISYSDMLSGSLTIQWASLATAHFPPLSNGVSGRLVRTSFAMDSKELSSISDCFGDKKSYQNTKT